MMQPTQQETDDLIDKIWQKFAEVVAQKCEDIADRPQTCLLTGPQALRKMAVALRSFDAAAKTESTFHMGSGPT
jgi:hypothetical protein